MDMGALMNVYEKLDALRDQDSALEQRLKAIEEGDLSASTNWRDDWDGCTSRLQVFLDTLLRSYHEAKNDLIDANGRKFVSRYVLWVMIFFALDSNCNEPLHRPLAAAQRAIGGEEGFLKMLSRLHITISKTTQAMSEKTAAAGAPERCSARPHQTPSPPSGHALATLLPSLLCVSVTSLCSTLCQSGASRPSWPRLREAVWRST